MSRQPQAVLYDAPGPRGRRTAFIVAVVVGVGLIAAAYFFVFRPLDEHDQFTAKKWGPIVDPSNEYFVLLWQRIGEGLGNTLTAAGYAIVASLVLGTLLGVVRIQLQSLRRHRYSNLGPAGAGAVRTLTWCLNGLTRFCVEIFRGLPVVITIFFVARGLPEFGLHFGDLTFLVIGLTIAEILRSGMSGLPRGQREAALSIGLSSWQTTILVLLPQALRIMLPALISQMVVVLKDTSLGGVVVGYDELLKVSSQAVLVLDNPIQIYTVAAVIFLTLNYTLSRLAAALQRRAPQWSAAQWSAAQWSAAQWSAAQWSAAQWRRVTPGASTTAIPASVVAPEAGTADLR
jgi:glutamate transport system permease protein